MYIYIFILQVVYVFNFLGYDMVLLGSLSTETRSHT